MNTYVIGKEYEMKALEILKKNGFSLCCKNYKGSLGEVDLIVQKNDLIVFVEVKYRKNKNYGYSMDSIDLKKGKKIYITALEYLEESKLFDAEYRFDAITFDNKDCKWTKNCLWGDELGF